MFDGLKDKLSGFGDEVEEEAEEVEAEEIDEADPDGVDASDEDDDEGSAGLREKARTLVGERAFIIEDDDLDSLLDDLEIALLSNDVEASVANDILDNVRQELVGEKRHWRDSPRNIAEEALRGSLVDVLSVDGIDFDSYVEEAEKPVVVIFTGVNGVGKTTTIAKIAKRLEDHGFSSVLANGDTFRAGANRQIEEHADALDKKIIKHDKGGDPTAVIYDAVEYAEANDVDVVLGDTAGRLHTSDDLMNQLSKIERVVEPDLTVFVDEAIAGQDAVNRAREFDEAAEIDGIVLTKADAD
ncbi:MAG: signal recognition particle receptor subunit alpha, partial [Halobacteria archaeon]|nr:signal recognition particle receptor subunit alpha [Halobacteria archaeon]